MSFIKKIAKITTNARKIPEQRKLTLREKWESWKELARIETAIKQAAQRGKDNCCIYIDYPVNVERVDTLGFIVNYIEKEKPYYIKIEWEFMVEDDNDDWVYKEE